MLSYGRKLVFVMFISIYVVVPAHMALQQEHLVAADSGHSADPEPMFTKDTMPAVSPTLHCVMYLSVLYFSLYTILTIIRTVNQFSGSKLLGVQKIVETGCTTVTYAPMLCVLFLGTRMRAIQLTQGETEKYGLPQWWVQYAMYSSLFAVITQVILVMVIGLLTGDNNSTVDADGNVDTSSTGQGGVVAGVLTAIRYILMLMLYGGFTTVIVGVFLMEGPKEIWGDEAPPVSPAVWNTILLTTLFFAVYLGVALTKSAQELMGASEFLAKLQGSCTFAKYTVNMAPMLCILFIGARMRALQIDPKNGNPQWWAQWCFYACSTSVLVQVLLVVVFPFCIKCTAKIGACEGDIVFETENKGISMCLTVVRYLALLALYGGFTAVMVSVFIIEHPTDVSLTPPISPAMSCVMNLTVQYFSVYLGLFICITMKQFSPPDCEFLSVLVAIFQAGVQTVMFAPMLSMLFIGCRMRALQLSKATDGTIPPSAGPPLYAQHGMFLATWSVLIQVLMALVVSCLTGGGKPEMDDDGCVKKPAGGNFILGMVLDTIRYLSLIAMYGGVVAVMVAVFMMTPEELQPYANKGLIPGVDVPTPPSPPTPSFF